MKTKKNFYLVLTVALLLILFIFLYIQSGATPEGITNPANSILEQDFNDQQNNSDENDAQEKEYPKVIRGVYYTAWTTTRKEAINQLIEAAETTNFNAVVIDVKDFSGFIFYNSQLEDVQKYGAKRVILPDLPSLLSELKNNGIYTIARLTVFQDPKLAIARPDIAIHSQAKISQNQGRFSSSTLWLDRSGLAWIDPAAEESWQYYADISKEAFEMGFDEINYDYIRFPSDGNLRDMHFTHWNRTTPRSMIMKNFFDYLRSEMPEKRLSVSLFGLTTLAEDDLGIGQIIMDSFPFFNFISPMVYPSHYARGFKGLANPAEYPYQVVYYSMFRAFSRLLSFEQSSPGLSSELRPWLQSFNLGAIYDRGMVNLQIQATKDALGERYRGYILWNSRNVYDFGIFKQ